MSEQFIGSAGGYIGRKDVPVNSVATECLQDNSVTKEKINSDVIGAGLQQNPDGTIEVSIDNRSLTVLYTAYSSSSSSGTEEGSENVLAINDLGVETRHLSDLSVTTAKIDDISITTGKIAALAVTTAKIDDEAVTTAKIDDAAVTNAKLDKTNIPLSGFGAAAANVSFGGFRATSVGEPVSSTDGATKNYVDSSVSAISNNVSRFLIRDYWLTGTPSLDPSNFPLSSNTYSNAALNPPTNWLTLTSTSTQTYTATGLTAGTWLVSISFTAACTTGATGAEYEVRADGNSANILRGKLWKNGFAESVTATFIVVIADTDLAVSVQRIDTAGTSTLYLKQINIVGIKVA